MQVILLQDVKSLGKKGELVTVNDSYARNFILPKKLGLEANARNLNDLKLKNAHDEKMAQQKLEEAKELAKVLEQSTVVVKMKSGKDGRTFGSISTKEIAEEAKKQLKLELDKKKILLDEPIRTLGVHIVKVKVHTEVTAKFHVHVKEA